MATVKKLNTTYTLDTTEVIVTGNLTIQGTQTTISSINTTITDKTLTLNAGEVGSGVSPAGGGTSGRNAGDPRSPCHMTKSCDAHHRGGRPCRQHPLGGRRRSRALGSRARNLSSRGAGRVCRRRDGRHQADGGTASSSAVLAWWLMTVGSRAFQAAPAGSDMMGRPADQRGVEPPETAMPPPRGRSLRK